MARDSGDATEYFQGRKIQIWALGPPGSHQAIYFITHGVGPPNPLWWQAGLIGGNGSGQK